MARIRDIKYVTDNICAAKMDAIEKAMEAKRPENVALVVTSDGQGKIDVTPICWFMNTSYKRPETWAISLWKGHYSTELIKKTKEFVLCIPSISQKKDISFCGSVSGRKVNKLDKCHFKLLKSSKIRTPMIANSIACFECKLIKNILVYDHMLFIGKVVAAKYFKKTQKVYHFGSYKLGTID